VLGYEALATDRRVIGFAGWFAPIRLSLGYAL
jgi:hypothetical protein